MDPNQPAQNIPVQAPPPVMPPQQQVPNTNKKKILIIIFGVVILIIVLVVSALIFIGKDSKKESSITPTPLLPLSPTPSVKKINETITLKKGIPTGVPDTDLELTFKGKDEPSEGCNDCITTTTIELIINGKKSDINYQCGGIVGTCSVKEQASGFEFELKENIDPNQIVILVTQL